MTARIINDRGDVLQQLQIASIYHYSNAVKIRINGTVMDNRTIRVPGVPMSSIMTRYLGILCICDEEGRMVDQLYDQRLLVSMVGEIDQRAYAVEVDDLFISRIGL